MTITLTREEAQQVLDAFVNWDARGRLRIIETLRARLEQSKVAREGPVREWARISQAEPEPVMLMDAPLLLNGQPLYTAPPQREWQGLTDEEVMSLLPGAVRLPPGWADTVRAIEAKLREKNT
jgi:hypothetical protein